MPVLFWFFVVLLLLCALALLLIWPGRPSEAQLAPFARRCFAHRGLHTPDKAVPENSLPAFRRAVEAGYGIELDIQLSRDGAVVVFHDDTLDRVCGVPGHLYEKDYAELKRLRLLGTDERIPLFSEVLAALDGMPVICEIKVPAGQDAAEICAKAAPFIDGYKGDICMESFNPKAVQWFRKNRPGLVRGQLTMNFMKEPCGEPLLTRIAMSHLLVNVLGRPDFIAYGDYTGDTAGFALCRLFHPMLAAWTVTSQEQQDQLKNRYHTVIFEQYLAQ